MAKKSKKKINKVKNKPAVAVTAHASAISAAVSTKPVARFDEKYKLPLDEIKRDLWKNVGYAVFAVFVVIMLKYTGFGFSFFQRILNF
jgi:hypothetical protein